MKTVALPLLSLSFLLVLSFLRPAIAAAQCPTGAIGVSGTGCGCLSGCNLTAFGGPNCTGATGNCSAGEVAMSVNIAVPAGCTYTVTATMANRTGGCSSSGADAGDQVKVDVAGGPKAFISGSGNATITDTYVLAGPGTIRVSGTANRADEIITYTTTSSVCINCANSLPVELTRFDAAIAGTTVECSWETASEMDNDFFTVGRSTDGIAFEPIGQMKGFGTTTEPHAYKLIDSSPLTNGVSYYRLTQTDFNGTITRQEMAAVDFVIDPVVSVFPNPSNGQLTIIGKQLEDGGITLRNALGQVIPLTVVVSGEHEIVYSVSGLANGLYIVTYPFGEEMRSEKVVVATEAGY